MSNVGNDAVLTLGTLEPWRRAGELAMAALRRRWRAIAALAVIFTGVGAGAAAVLPRTYSAESRILVRKNYVMPALASPRRAVPIGSEAPAQSAAELVLSRQSLRTLVERRQLLERWERERPALLRLKDRVLEAVRGPVPDEEKMEAIIELLGARIHVRTEEEIIRVGARWSDPETVVAIVDGAVEAFLDARRRADVDTVADTYQILEGFTDRARAHVERQLASVASERRAAALQSPHAPRRRSQAAAGASTDGLEDLRAAIRTARDERLALEREHDQKVADLQARIAERRAVLTERHPEIQSLRRTLDGLTKPPAALAAARGEEARLLADYTARGGSEAALTPQAATPAHAVAQVLEVEETELPTPVRRRPAVHADAQGNARLDQAYAMLASGATDEVTERLALDDLAAYVSVSAGDDADLANLGRTLLKNSIDTYEDLRTRLANVQIELETQQAAFDYRYSITAPARLPKRPDSPKAPLVVVGGLLAGLASGVAFALFGHLRAQSLLSPSALAAHLGVGTPEVR